MSRKDKFRQAVAARQEEKSAQNEYEEIAYVPLKKNKQHTLRFIGLPERVRESGSDVRFLSMAMIRDDHGKWIRVVYPKDSDWFLNRVYRTVCSYDWDDESNTPNYHHSDLEIFKKVRYNNLPPQKRRMSTGWRPQNSYLVNVIDRSDPEWHQQNKHTKAIARKMTVKEDNTYYTPGLPVSAYQSIQDDIQRLEDNIDWEEYDIVVEKLDDSPWYKVYHGEKDSHRLESYAQEQVVAGPLSNEEAEYEKYDFDKLFPVTSYRKILNHLRLQIQEVDEAFDTKYLAELESLAASEKKEAEKTSSVASATPSNSRDEEDVEESDEATEDDQVEDSAEPTEAPKSEDTPRRSRRRKAEPSESTKSFNVDDLDPAKYKGVKSLTQEMKDMIVGVDDEGKLKFVEDADVEVCMECGEESPLDFSHCPYCGVEFE